MLPSLSSRTLYISAPLTRIPHPLHQCSPHSHPVPSLYIADDVHAAAHDGPSTSAAAAGKAGMKRGRDGKPLLGKAQAQRRKGGAATGKDEEFGVTRGIDFKVLQI